MVRSLGWGSAGFGLIGSANRRVPAPLFKGLNKKRVATGHRIPFFDVIKESWPDSGAILDSICEGASPRRRWAMTGGNALQILLERVRSGDQQAATELVRRYEPALRRAVRLRLRDRHLRRRLDSSDVCQSVLVRFLRRVADGAYNLNTPEDILKLLATMARNQVVNEALHQQAAKRDYRRQADSRETNGEVAARGSSPSQHVAADELLSKARELISPAEWRLLELRKEGREWAEIALVLGGTPEGLRKQLARAIARVTEAMGVVELPAT
jgi:RNA polymerase sigma-70 factor (ECF subfamily)